MYVCMCACVVHVGKVVCCMVKDAVQSGLRHHTQLTGSMFTLQDQLVAGKQEVLYSTKHFLIAYRVQTIFFVRPDDVSKYVCIYICMYMISSVI